MKNFLFKYRNKFRKQGSLHFHSTDFLQDIDNGLYVEDYFHEMVYLERKRAERSGKSFLLMLLDLENILYEPSAKEIIKGIGYAINTTTREVDIKGWYKCNGIIGVIFTDVKTDEAEPIKQKIFTALTNLPALSSTLFNRLKISFHLFPEESGGDKSLPLDFKLYPDLLKKKENKKNSFLIKRVMDVFGAFIGLIIFSPFFIAVPVIIKLTSKGPVFFRQTRIGEYGKPFVFLKFRSMYVGSSEKIHTEYIKKLIREQKEYSLGGNHGAEEKIYKIKDDPRITPLGRILRKTSLDELPQFFNVIKGDMSLVGPRPPIPYELENYMAWHRRRILDVKPGITGLWQVKGRSSTTFNDMVRMDIRYIDEWSIWLDIKLLFLTPFSMLSSKGAY
ncbi:MAG: sugar transferase [Deltaproteobacteria bacterium]|nr:sugar transferase [Deltaproteobacteria bacterium]